VNFILENWPLMLVAATSGGFLLWPMVSAGSGVGTAEAVRLINREKAVLVDVGEPAEYAAEHPAGSKNVPLGALDGSKLLPSNKTTPVVLVCKSGARAARAATLLRKAGYEKAVSLSGGTAAWRDANLPMDKAA
jgi:rhodanese-related sulfurtransferase